MNAIELWVDYVNLPTTEKWRFIRQLRTELLAACDWTQLPDTILSDQDRNIWKSYRQSLRDLPQQHDDPDSVIFPEKP